MTQFPLPVGGLDLASLDTPCYLYDMDLLRATVDSALTAADHPAFRIHYAMKANVEQPVMDLMLQSGLGVDTVSGGEIRLALDLGFPAEKIVFAGVGKTDAEIDLALSNRIGCLNVESLEELDIIARRAEALNCKAPVALRVNPDIDAHTHHYITTGLAENKFGISMTQLDKAIDMIIRSPHLNFRGLHFHIGSQITIMEPYRVLCERINGIVDRLSSRGIDFPTINLGGGLGVDYDSPDTNPIPDFGSFFNVIKEHLDIRPGQEIHFELGRSLVAQCGSLLTRVIYVKKGIEKQFAIVDAGFTDLIRPALYGAHHLIQNVTSAATSTEIYDVVGPVCESSDTFGTAERLPVTRRGDILALRSAGAYGSVMAMGYNCRRLPMSVFINR